MAIDYQVLGAAGRDNALLVRIDSGQAVETLLFDCGEGCLSPLSLGQIRGIDHLFFSHLHMDHVAGFDTFFRANYDRATKPNHLWGPAGTARIMQHRFQGFLWNLNEEMSASWLVHDVEETHVTTARFELAEDFEERHEEGLIPREGPILEGTGYTIEAAVMDHRTPSLAYLVRERPRRNVDTSRLAALELKPGPWIKTLTGPALDEDIVIDDRSYLLSDLRSELLVETPGVSVAYLTDFRMDHQAVEKLVPLVSGCDTIVCEAQYREADWQLAEKNFHMTCVEAAGLAARAEADRLILFHLSDRYRPPEWRELLDGARAVFPNTSFPADWKIDA